MNRRRTLMLAWSVRVLGLCVCALCFASAPGQTRTPASDGAKAVMTEESSALQTARGLSGSLRFEHASPNLRARPNDAFNSPVVIRLEREGDTGASPAKYRLDYRVAKAGEFDLARYLENENGATPAGLKALKVKIVSNLPASHGSDLFGVQRPGFRLSGYYRELLVVLGVVWVLIPVGVWMKRRLSAPVPVVVVPPTPPPTVAEQIRTLVAEAGSTGLSVSDRGRLELLLLGFWRERLGFERLDIPEAVMRMRRDEEAGELLRAVERWLHGPDRSAPFPEHELTRMLERYEISSRPANAGTLAEVAG